MALLTSFLVAVHDVLGLSQVPKQLRLFEAHPVWALRLWLASLL